MSSHFDRSRRVAAEECSRKRYWGYEHNGTGLEPLTSNIYLSTGSAIHKGLESLLVGHPLHDALLLAAEAYNAELGDGLAPVWGESTPVEVVKQEQASLIEALIRAWSIVRLPVIQAQWKTLAVEQERVTTLGNDLTFMVRTDVEQESLTSGLIYIRDFKTVGNIGPWWSGSFRYDTLTLSQVIPVEEAYNRKLGGVIIEGLCKGKRSAWPKSRLELAGQKYQDSPLIYGWYRPAREAEGRKKAHTEDWQARYDFTCSAEHIKEDGKACPGNVTHTRAGYYRRPIWSDYPGGIAAWIAFLAESDRSLLEEQFIELPPIIRSDWEVEEWKTSVIAQESEIRRKAKWIAALQKTESFNLAKELAELFPKSTSSGKCQSCIFNSLCWGNADPDDPTMFQPRNFNHSTESEEVNA